MNKPNPRKVLFITWDAPETLYLERLFLPIFYGLKAHGFEFHVLQFSWGTELKSKDRAKTCSSLGIPYRDVKVWRNFRPIGPYLSALWGGRSIQRAVSEWRIDTLLLRSLMPALAVSRLKQSEKKKLNIVFDADGLAADERVDFGNLSTNSLTYRILRDVEAELLRSSDAVLTRTPEAKSILLARSGPGLDEDSCFLVPNGIDPRQFSEKLSKMSMAENPAFKMCYCGSMGSQYRLQDMLQVALRMKSFIPDLHFQILSPGLQEVENALIQTGLNESNWITYTPVSPKEVPKYLVECDLGIALRQASFSTQAVMPIKLGEYLLAGLPIIGTPGVGDTKTLEAEGVFGSAESDQLERTIRWIIDEVRPRRNEFRMKSHEAGVRHFGLDETVIQYAAALKSLRV